MDTEKKGTAPRGSDGFVDEEKEDKSKRRRYLNALQNRDVETLRIFVAKDGLPEETRAERSAWTEARRSCTLRGKVWCAMLGIDEGNIEMFEKDFRKNCSKKRTGRKKEAYGTVSVDVDRTFRIDEDFRRCVSPTSIERVVVAAINASASMRYTQGLCSWCGMFLYEMPEALAFACLGIFAEQLCPTYMQRGNPGAHEGVRLLGECMKILTPKLLEKLQRIAGGGAKPLVLFAFAPIHSFCTSLAPLGQIRHLWDMMLAFGLHLNVLFVLSHVVLQSETIFEARNFERVQRIFDPRRPERLHARSVVHVAMELLPKFDEARYKALEAHLVRGVAVGDDK